MPIKSIIRNKDRIISIIFMVIAFASIYLYVRESSNLSTAQVDHEGCEAHKRIMVERAKKLQSQLMIVTKNGQISIEELVNGTSEAAAQGTANAASEDLNAAAIAVEEAQIAAQMPQGAAVEINQVSPALIAARINAINKIIQLSPEQTTALEKHFGEKLAGQEISQPFEDIIGQQNADFYKQQVKKSFDRAVLESFEKEVFYIGNKIGLSPDQERDLISIMQQTYEALPNAPAPTDESELLTREGQLKIAQDNVRFQQEFNEALKERMGDVLTEDQTSKYLELKAQGSEQDMQLWHE